MGKGVGKLEGRCPSGLLQAGQLELKQIPGWRSLSDFRLPSGSLLSSCSWDPGTLPTLHFAVNSLWF